VGGVWNHISQLGQMRSC